MGFELIGFAEGNTEIWAALIAVALTAIGWGVRIEVSIADLKAKTRDLYDLRLAIQELTRVVDRLTTIEELRTKQEQDRISNDASRDRDR